MRDLQSFKPENIDLILKVVRTYANVSSSKVIAILFLIK